MKPLTVMHFHRHASRITHVFAAAALASVTSFSWGAVDLDQSHVAPPSGDGWQILSATSSVTSAPGAPVASTPLIGNAAPKPMAGTSVPTGAHSMSLAVAPVVLPSSGPVPAPPGLLTLAITPQDINLRNALDRWLQQQGWQLAWKIDDDLPLEFNATFSGDFTSVLTQVMQATNHMQTPTRICRHTNNVIRVVARAANCQD